MLYEVITHKVMGLARNEFYLFAAVKEINKSGKNKGTQIWARPISPDTPFYYKYDSKEHPANWFVLMTNSYNFV